MQSYNIHPWAGMGIDVRGLNLAVNVGIPKTPGGLEERVNNQCASL